MTTQGRNLMARRLAAHPMDSPARESYPTMVGAKGSRYACVCG